MTLPEGPGLPSWNLNNNKITQRLMKDKLEELGKHSGDGSDDGDIFSCVKKNLLPCMVVMNNTLLMNHSLKQPKSTIGLRNLEEMVGLWSLLAQSSWKMIEVKRSQIKKKLKRCRISNPMLMAYPWCWTCHRAGWRPSII